LRQLRADEVVKQHEAKVRHEQLLRSEARSMHRLFEPDYVKGKGVKSGGYGDIIVGRHYEMKKQFLDIEAEQRRNKSWLDDFKRKQEEKRRKRQALENEA